MVLRTPYEISPPCFDAAGLAPAAWVVVAIADAATATATAAPHLFLLDVMLVTPHRSAAPSAT
jgi:hypothetical protein